MITNDDLIQDYIHSRGLSRNTYLNMKIVLNHYSQFQKATLQELLEEADQEEEQKIRWKHRTLKKRLTFF